MSPVIKHIPFFSPARNALSGQVFRFKVIDPAHTELVAFGRYLQIAELGNDDFAFSCSEDDWNGIWYRYFDMERDYGAVVSSIDPSDEYLAAAAAFGHGIRILRQDIWETVISYIISQRRSIPSITTSVERISRLWGQRIAVPELGDPFVKPLCDEYYSFPSVSELSSATLADISSTGVGYRAEYIMSALDDFRSGKLTCEMLESKSDSELYDILISMHGVGKKVANCIMLYAFARCGRFPIDVWMERIVNRYYGGRFCEEKYPGTCGIMQQFMFYYERNETEHK